ncbi:ABC transporter permease [Thermococcus barophilus]|uniref:ABC-2 type transporter transmembrane domain-containing protein n=1 Tax=Thermococcus barophilus (strain DSM 11836 / MP) TaxID=391623 RepID=F0LH01_THEBM|nr:ABC transporter permease [Thermococcus barophilus]ADT84209.1 hypothetical protein TERMP_01233 [Thermococcus barophilus MP]
MRILAIARKEAKIQLRYRIVWLNFALTPFFIISPWILTAKSFSVEFGEAVLIGSLMWYWLNQYFFGVQEAFEEEREEGTLVSIALSPISLLEFLIGKGLWMLVECVYITVVTMLIFWMLGISQALSLKMLLLYVVSGLYMFAFSILWGALILWFRRIGGINFIVQEVLGLTSGITADVSAYPKFIRFAAYAVPLTYTIKIGRMIFKGASLDYIVKDLGILTAVTIIYFIIGALMLKKAEQKLRIYGEWEAW